MSRQISISRLTREPPVTDQVYGILVYEGTSLKPAKGDLDPVEMFAITGADQILGVLIEIPGTGTARLVRVPRGVAEYLITGAKSVLLLDGDSD